MRNFAVLIFLFMFSLNLSAQRFTEFSTEPEAFLDEMDELFARSNTNYKMGKDLLSQFEEPWLEGGFSKARQEKIYEVANLMLKRNARNFPHFYDYIQALLTFYQYKIDSVNYYHWEQALIHLATVKNGKLSDISSFINSSIYLIKENAVYYSPSIKWYANNNNYKIVFENDTISYQFEQVNLTGKLRNDSIQIHETSGSFYPITNEWKGKSAKVYWDKTGLGRDTTWAEIDSYHFPMNKSFYTIEQVRFYNKTYFDYPLLGTLTDKVVEVTSPDRLSYPRFESKESLFEIKGIFTDIDYKGGFSMQGAKLIGTGNKDNLASLSLFRDVELVVDGDTVIEKRVFMKTHALYYAFSENEIVSRNAKISMYIAEDSIYHPGLLFRYYDTHREVNLIRDKNPENMSRSPYYDGYHKIEMDFELLKWYMDETFIDFTMLRGSSLNVAMFESADYFSAARFYEVLGLEQVHPYVSLRNFAKHNQTESFYAEDLAKFMRLPLTPVKRLLIELTYTGIVDYDFETEYCTLKPKLYKYLDAIVGKSDYDLIQFESRTTAPDNNAVLNLKNMDLAIKGVPRINLSDSQNVIFYPKNQEILLKKNRDFDFGGIIQAGFFTYHGDNFQFKYDSFKIVLNKVDSLSIKVKSGVDNWGQQVLANVENVIEEVTGDLIIDDPNNKSGVKHFPQYPIFASKNDSYVYYDDKNIQNGKYTRDKFFYKVYPYVIDSLNNFSTEGMGYEGELHSADIFPVIEQPLVLQKDNSLGFHYDTPEHGLPLFKGKGQYYADVNLSNSGLRGNGKMTYLTSQIASNNFIFYPDSANAKTTEFTIARQNQAVQYPDVAALQVYVHWMPYNDVLTANTLEQDFAMYTRKSSHNGILIYSPKELVGSGKNSYSNGTLTSDKFTFKADRFNSDTAEFELKSVNPEMLALTTQNINAKVDFLKMESEFKSNTGSSKVDLPENLYQAYVEKFIWKMNDKTMQLATPNTVQIFEQGKNRIVTRQDAGLDSKGSLFVSQHSGQDSLNWISPTTDFDLSANILYAHEVKYIDVADARVFPFEGEVTIEPVAKMRTLNNAKLLANTDTKYHRFESSTINISSRKRYQGNGKYLYLDEVGRQFPINFELIAVDSLGQTFAKGKIKGIEDFSLSPAFAYQGNVLLNAQNPLLYFDGATRINHECTQIEENWLKFETEIDPKNIYIPLEEPLKDINESFLVSGAMLATDSVHVFPAFVSPRKRYSNLAVAAAAGYLTFDNKEKKYKIAQMEKLMNNDTTGNLLTLHKNFCNIYGEGHIDLTANLGQVKIQSKGNANYLIPDDKLNLEVLMTLDFFFPEASIKFISDTLASMTGLKPVNLKSRTYTRAVKELLDYKEADNMLKEQAIFGTVKQVPKALASTFVFSDLNLVWNKTASAWQSKGDLGIANILGNQLNRKVKGNLEVQRRRSGDSFTLYLEFSENHWYFFYYKRGLMQAYSSEAGFNNIIADIKGSDRKLKINRGEASYVFFLSNKKRRDDFLKHLSGEPVQESELDEDLDYEKYEEYN